MREFICGSDVTDADVEAYDAGLLVPWRVAADGTQWYKRLDSSQREFRTIKAVPPQAATSAGDRDGFGEPAGLTDAERVALLQWADEMRRGGGDPEGADDDPE